MGRSDVTEIYCALFEDNMPLGNLLAHTLPLFFNGTSWGTMINYLSWQERVQSAKLK